MLRENHTTVWPTARPPAGDSWPISPIDRFASQWVIQGTWVFDASIDAVALQRGLSRLLDAYPILSGRVSGSRIRPSGRGVPFVEATDWSVSVADLERPGVDATRFGHRLSATGIRSGLAPLLAVKLTHVEGGFVLGICCSHACLDGNGFYSMASNFSRAATGRPLTMPTFQRAAVRHPRRSRSAVARSARDAGWHRLSIGDGMRFATGRRGRHDRSFVAYFCRDALRRSKEAMTRELADETVSTNSSLVAHVAHCLVGLLGLDERATFVLSAAVDQRERCTGVSGTFARNAVSAIATPPIPAAAQTADIARRLHQTLSPLVRRPSSELDAVAALTSEVAAHRLPFSTIPAARLLGKRPTLFYTNSFTKFPVYDLDFGSASSPVRPVRAIPHNLGDLIVLWPAPPPAGGIELYFSGALAHAVARLNPDDAWWSELRRFDEADRGRADTI